MLKGRKQHQRGRVKAAGGGKTKPAKDYKPRKDIGQQRQASTRVQQPEKKRGSASLSPREQQRKAALERRAAKSGAKSNKKAKRKFKRNYKVNFPSSTCITRRI